MSIYANNGYINIPYITGFNANFIIMIGERQIGKTYGTLNYLTNILKTKVLLVRRTDDECDMLARKSELNPYHKINLNEGSNIKFNSLGHSMYSIDCVLGYDKNDKEILENRGMLISLSRVAKIRGFDGTEFTDVVIDEFIPESHVQRLKKESDAILNMYTTVSGNREIEAKKPLRMWMLANSNNLGDIVLSGLGLTDDFESMIRTGKNLKYLEHRKALLIYSNKSPIAEERKKNALSTFLTSFDSEFAEMAFNAKFSYNDTMHVTKIKNIKQLKPLVNVGDIYIYRYNNIIFCTNKKYCEFNCVYGANNDEIRRFKNDWYNLKSLDIEGEVYYNSYNCKNKLAEILNIKIF